MGSVELACVGSGNGPDLDSEGGRVGPRVTRTSGGRFTSCILLGTFSCFIADFSHQP